MTLNVEIERSQETGEWVAEIPELPGCMVVEETEALALKMVEALALRVIADRIEHGEELPAGVDLSFVTRAA